MLATPGRMVLQAAVLLNGSDCPSERARLGNLNKTKKKAHLEAIFSECKSVPYLLTLEHDGIILYVSYVI